jgi:hypothetical protein
MKSFRLKRRNHTKSRKGGNGNSSSSSSPQVSFNDLKKLFIELKVCRGLLIKEEMEPGKYHIDKIEEYIKNIIEKLLSIFNEDKINLSQLTIQQEAKLLDLIAEITGITDNYDQVTTQINNQIIEAYAKAYLRYKDTHNSSLLEIEYLDNEIKERENIIDTIGEDPNEDETVQMYQNQIENIAKIRDIFIAEKTRMVNNISFLPKEKYPGPKALSTHRGLLPDPQVAHVMSYLIPNFSNESAKPTQYSTVLSNTLENIKTMPSKSEKGGSRRKRIRRRTRKLRRTMKRK